MNRYNLTEYPYHLDSKGEWVKWADHLRILCDRDIRVEQLEKETEAEAF